MTVARDMGKGKARRDVQLPDGPGGSGGIVLPLDVTTTGSYDISYTIKVGVGSNNQQVSLQVDTGSSDLWIASSECTSSLCKQTSGHVYDPSISSTPTASTFSISYLSGSASGPIVWDTIQLGTYSISNQALAAATNITNEPLSPSFSGVLGLALPLNSVIASVIPPVTSNAADGAAFASNLFSITPASSAPAAPFLSLSLSRPGSATVPATLGIGRHLPSLVPDPSKIMYSTLVSESAGTLFWKVNVRAITVYVDSLPKPVNIGKSNTGAVFPTAVLDTGVPLILTTSQVANGIYGALGIGPASDGQYYVPCTTPLNLTITLDNRPELPLHPLDLTTDPPSGNNAAFCIGLIQAADGVLARPGAGIGDMVLGVPFLRNVYTVMAYDPPAADGSFVGLGAGAGENDRRDTNATTTTTAGDTSPTSVSAAASAPINPRLGLLSLTTPSTALSEFHRVRVLNQPLSSPSPSPSSSSSGANVKAGGGRVSVGVVVLIAVVGFFGCCFVGFAVRWWVLRRRWRRGVGVGAVLAAGAAGGKEEKGVYVLTRRSSKADAGESTGVAAYIQKKLSGGDEERTMSSTSTTTRVGAAGGDAELGMGYKSVGARTRDSGVDFGERRGSSRGSAGASAGVWSPAAAAVLAGAAWWGDGRGGDGDGDGDDTVDGHIVHEQGHEGIEAQEEEGGGVVFPSRPSSPPPLSPTTPTSPTELTALHTHTHKRTPSEEAARLASGKQHKHKHGHKRGLSIGVPLLGEFGELDPDPPDDEDGRQGHQRVESMAGVGTALRSGRVRTMSADADGEGGEEGGGKGRWVWRWRGTGCESVWVESGVEGKGQEEGQGEGEGEGEVPEVWRAGPGVGSRIVHSARLAAGVGGGGGDEQEQAQAQAHEHEEHAPKPIPLLSLPPLGSGRLDVPVWGVGVGVGEERGERVHGDEAEDGDGDGDSEGRRVPREESTDVGGGVGGPRVAALLDGR